MNNVTARITLDSSNPNWHPNAAYTRVFVQATQNLLNDMLQVRGHLFLNEVHDAFAVKRTSAGQRHGWVRGEVVSFEVTTTDSETTIDMVVPAYGLIYQI